MTNNTPNVAMNWEHSRFKGGRKWVCWSAGCWVTYRKGQPLHIGFNGKHVGTWEMEPDAAKAKLEQMHRELILTN